MPEDGVDTSTSAGSATSSEAGERPLSVPQRLAFSALGLAAAGAGSAGVFVSENATGPAALLAVGAFFLAIGILGNPVRRIKVGDNEIELGLRRVIGDLVGSEDREVANEVADAVLSADLPADDPLVARAAAWELARTYEQSLTHSLVTLGATVEWPPGTYGADLGIRWKDRLVAIEAKYARSSRDAARLARTAFSKAVSLKMAANQDHRPEPFVLIVSNIPLGPPPGTDETATVGVTFASWDIGDDDGRLVSALDAAVGLSNDTP